MRKNFKKYLVLSFILTSCASAQKEPVKFTAEWEFINSPKTQESKACLNQKGVEELSALLIRCERK